jgi:hypothetical protein
MPRRSPRRIPHRRPRRFPRRFRSCIHLLVRRLPAQPPLADIQRGAAARIGHQVLDATSAAKGELDPLALG